LEGNDGSHWRDFEENVLTHSMAHYLMAIDSLRNEYGYARATDVADFLSVSRGAASMALNQLKKRGWVAEDPNRFLLLTEEGKQIATLVEQNFFILSKFFEEMLGVDKDTAMSDACKMEHLMSMETGKRLVWLMRYVMSDPAIAANIRETMADFRYGCEPSDTECPICGGVGECLAAAEPPATASDAP
jgi:Mn-dependent DtxR family transcriptional regulator